MRKLKKPYSQNWRGLSAKWLFILSTVLGIIAGTLFLVFLFLAVEMRSVF